MLTYNPPSTIHLTWQPPLHPGAGVGVFGHSQSLSVPPLGGLRAASDAGRREGADLLRSKLRAMYHQYLRKSKAITILFLICSKIKIVYGQRTLLLYPLLFFITYKNMNFINC